MTERRKKAEELFDAEGNFTNGYDPYRAPENDPYFDEDGYPTDEVYERAQDLVETGKMEPYCNAMKLVHACAFASSTKGNYAPCYMWR